MNSGDGNRRLQALAWAALAAAVAFGVFRVVREAWVCDDAFITFRYAKNLIAGLGPVYNAGERVEGYVHPLWLALIAAGMGAGLDPIAVAQGLGALFWIGTVALLVRIGRGLHRRAAVDGSAAGPFVPVAAIGLAVHLHFAIFATCGLETPMFAFFATLLLDLLIRAETAAGFFAAGCASVLLTLARIDGAIFGVVALGAAIGASRRARSLRPVIALALAPLLVYVPYFLWRWSYYGWPLPNLFYAKTADRPYLSQGLAYLGLYFSCYWILALGLAGAGRALPRGPLRRAAALVLAFAGAQLAYTAWVGGDFMFARFCLPVTPALYLGAELVAAGIRSAAGRLVVAAFVAAGSFALAYPGALRERGVRGIGEEKSWYPDRLVDEARRQGLHLRRMTAGTDARVLIVGTQAMLAYYGDFPLVVEGATGLTDEHLAHLPLDARGPIGHEKGIARDPGYAVARGIDFAFALLPSKGPPLRGDLFDPRRAIDFGEGVKGTIVCYRRDVLDAVRRRGAIFLDLEASLDEYLRRIGDAPLEQVRRDWAFLEPYYFAHNDDPERERPFRERMR